MQNKEKGEIKFHCDYGNQEITLVYNFNAFVKLESLFDGQSAPLILQKFAKQMLGFDGFARLFLAGMSSSNMDEELSVKEQLAEVGKIIDSIGGIAEVTNVMSEAINRAFPEPKAGDKKKRKAKE